MPDEQPADEPARRRTDRPHRLRPRGHQHARAALPRVRPPHRGRRPRPAADAPELGYHQACAGSVVAYGADNLGSARPGEGLWSVADRRPVRDRRADRGPARALRPRAAPRGRRALRARLSGRRAAVRPPCTRRTVAWNGVPARSVTDVASRATVRDKPEVNGLFGALASGACRALLYHPPSLRAPAGRPAAPVRRRVRADLRTRRPGAAQPRLPARAPPAAGTSSSTISTPRPPTPPRSPASTARPSASPTSASRWPRR